MLEANIHCRIHYVLSAFIAFLLPFKIGVPILIGLLFLNWLLSGNLRNKVLEIKGNKIAILFLLLYTLYALGLFWSSNLDAGWFDLQVKLSLLIFPIIYSTYRFDIKERNRVIAFFVLGCIAACIILLVRAAYCYFFQDQNVFLYVDFSRLMHPSYFAMYLNFALVCLLMPASHQEEVVFKYRWVAIVLFSLVIILLCSKIGYIGLLLTILVWSVIIIVRYKRIFAGISSIVGISGILIFSVCNSNLIYGRFKGVLATLTTDNSNKANTESTAVRINIWKAAIELSFKKPLLGYGTGSAEEQLMNKYKEEGITRAYLLKLNAHNAFCQVLVPLGYIGLSLFLLTLLFPMMIAVKERNWLFVFFVALFMLSCIPESILEAQAGTMYYGFFSSMLFFKKLNL